jgi:acetyltransferase
VADDVAGKGLGTKLMVSLMRAAREQGLKEIEGSVLNNNHRMLALMNGLGFAIKRAEDDHELMKVSKLL